MQRNLEKELVLSNVTVQLATLNWEGVEDRPKHRSYSLFQRLSGDHPPLRIGNISIPEMLPRARSVGFLPAGQTFRLLPLEKPLRVLHCFYDTEFLENITGITKEQWQQHTGSLATIKNQRLEILMQEVYAELEQPGFAHELFIEYVTNLMLIELARYVRELDRKSSKRGDVLALAPWQLQRIQERIDSSLEMGYPNLSELAELCSLSQSHLARSFKLATGWPIHQYIARERLNTAKKLLAQQQLSCEDVAQRLGFKSPGYFSTAFRRMTGKTPTEYRRQVLGKNQDNAE